jgi:hypothetical protein
VFLVPALFTIIFMSDVHVAMAGDHVIRRATGQKSRLERAGQPMRSVQDRFPTLWQVSPILWDSKLTALCSVENFHSPAYIQS